MRQLIKFGEIEVGKDAVTISDNARLALRLEFALGLVLAVVGSIQIAEWIANDEATLAYTDIFVLCTGFFFVINRFSFSAQSLIDFAEIKEIKHVRRFGNQWIDIKLKSKIRRIHASKVISERLRQTITPPHSPSGRVRR